jgi:hypothetical protein
MHTNNTVYSAGDTAFFCPYRDTHITTKDVHEINRLLNKKCGNRAQYGYLYFNPPEDSFNPGKYAEYSVGRTWRGDHFCTPTFAPGSHDQRDTLFAPHDVSLTQVEQLHDKRDESLYQAESSMDQGDGLYTARFDDTGKMTVAFTSKAELVARDAEALKKRSIKTWCSGAKSKNTQDLNWAIAQLGKNAQGVHYSAKYWGWVHK